MFTLDMGGFTIGVMPVILAVVVGIGVPLLAALLPIFVGTRLTVREALVGYGLQGEAHRSRFARGLGHALTFIPAL
jgi:putative ABC transport system permease protein